jgi:hypothetical protein
MSSARPQLAPWPTGTALPNGRTPLAHLLHALNQPLTGLQCSLELAAAGPRPTDQYIRTLREGLDLVMRMRILVEAIREVADAKPSKPEEHIQFRLETLLFDAAAELQPVAEAKSVRIRVTANAALQVYADRGLVAALMFRLFESALSLSSEQSVMEIVAVPERDAACVTLSWTRGAPAEHSPFSRPELGLLVAHAGWEQAGGSWTDSDAGVLQTCVLRFPLVANPTLSNRAAKGDLK